MNNAILEIVREGFEEQKGIKILSLFFTEEKRIEGIYIIPPDQSLSFLQLPLLDMYTTLEDYKIFLIELGEILRYSYKMGSLHHFNNLLIASEINCENNLFDALVDYCRENPPMLMIKTSLIEWIKRTDEVMPIRTQTFLKQCENFNKLDELDYDEDLDLQNESAIINQFHHVRRQLEDKKYKKVTELAMNRIDKTFIQMQIDLYTTDDK